MDAQKTYIEDTTKWAILIIMSLLILSFPLALYKNIPFQYILILLTVFTAIPFFLNVEKIIYLLSFYIIAFGIFIFKGNLYPLSVSYIITDLVLVILFIILITDISLNKIALKVPYFGWSFALFIVTVVISFFIGLNNTHELRNIYNEFRIVVYYTIYYVALQYFNKDRRIIIFSCVVVLATILASFDAIYTYNSLNLDRFVSRQVHMFALVIPFLVSLMILDKHKLRKLFYFVVLIPLIISVVISQTRGTWFSLVIAILLAIFLSVYAEMKGSRRFVSLLFILSILVVILFISVNLIGKISQTKVEFVEKRVESVTTLKGDYSLLMRVNSYSIVMNKIRSHPWFGNGFGAKATYNFFGRYSTQHNVDSTYLTILWKMGIVGLIAFLILYFFLIKRAFLIYRRTENKYHKIFSIGIISSFIGFLIIGIISPILITTRFNLLFGVLFAITDVISKKYSTL